MPRIIAAATKPAANAVLEQWVDSIGKPDSCAGCADIKQDRELQGSADYGELLRANNLGVSLAAKLLFIKNNRNQDDNYYVNLVSGIGNPNFDHENPYNQMVYPDPGYRLLALYRYWNIIQYFYP